MPVERLTERGRIRALLEVDRVWAAYALGDLQPGMFEECAWYRLGGALALVYSGLRPPVLYTQGPAEDVRALLLEVAPGHRELYLLVRPEHLQGLAGVLKAARPLPIPKDTGTGVWRMLLRGVFYGLRAGGQLAAVAGTHLVSVEEGVAAVGNVFTRPELRGRHLGRDVTWAVTDRLLGLGIRTIILNVAQRNASAIRLYEHLGYRRYCAFYEGLARACRQN
ncbi:MAG: GNAT family N-acetyltransferase [Chloroflexi bacterium]|nr:GNAT family N-acetyltransferase [Chloroflexota bacterium]